MMLHVGIGPLYLPLRQCISNPGTAYCFIVDFLHRDFLHPEAMFFSHLVKGVKIPFLVMTEEVIKTNYDCVGMELFHQVGLHKFH